MKKEKHVHHVAHSTSHATHTPASTQHHSGAHLEETLIHNMVELQKVHVDMAQRFDKLSNQISQLLGLFEMTARSFGQQSHGIVATEKDREFLDKIDKLLDQNKTIAKGLTLMEEKMREKVYGHSTQMPPINPQQMMQSQYRPPYSDPQLTPPRPLPRE
jgi:hypothetical protein